MSAPAVSVIVPVFNAAQYLAASLDSIVAIGQQRLEVIVVDDGSTDGSRPILDEYAARHDFIRVLHQANAGAAAARNHGLQAATGTYVWFVDADDLVVPGAWQVLEPVLREGHDLIAFNGERFRDDAALGKFYQGPKPRGTLTGEAWVTLLCRQREFHHLVYLHLYRRDFLQQIALRFREGILHEDIGWVTESGLRARTVCYLDRVLYRYRRNPQSETGRRDDEKLIERIRSYFVVVPQLREINLQCAMTPASLRLLRAEVVAQGLQVDRLAARLAARERRIEVYRHCRQVRFWRGLWQDATTFKSQRQLLKVMLRQYLRTSWA